MNGSAGISTLDTCGCFPAGDGQLPLYNRPGLQTLAYRIGTHPTLLRDLLAHLPLLALPDGAHAGSHPLSLLTTREGNDPAIALLDAWAVMADVLTFYQERIANEGFLGTATERRSVLELARAIGYELRPGVAASTYLSFTVMDAPGSARSVVVPRGTQIQSVPAQGQLPQTFETAADLATQVEWNELRPRLTRPQPMTAQMTTVYLAGVTTNLSVGDVLLLAVPPDGSGALQTKIMTVGRVEVEAPQNRTQVDLQAPPPPAPPPPTPLQRGTVTLDRFAFNEMEVDTRIVGHVWRERDLDAFLSIEGWNPAEMVAHIDRPAPPPAPAPPSDQLPPPAPGVFAFRLKASPFGYNAPLHSSLPSALITGSGPYTTDWDDTTSSDNNITNDSHQSPYNGTSHDTIALENVFPGIVRGSWLVLTDHSNANSPRAYEVAETWEASRADYAMSGKTTTVRLAQPDCLTSFRLRTSTVYGQSQSLPLADLPFEDPISAGDTALDLDSMVLGLAVGRPVALTGERADLSGVTTSEIAILADVIHSEGHTTLAFQQGLQHSYIRSTVTISANVAAATHGETVRETLGSGDGSQSNQRFTLKKPPLTYVSASTPDGAASTLEVRVDGVMWHQVPRLWKLDGRSEDYAVQIDDSGRTNVVFGDGIVGARLPTGSENVVATYRSGIGLQGMVPAGSLSLLKTRPQSIQAVTNPLAASGAANPEDRDAARTNAPLTVLTLDRIVSLQDYEDFAGAFAGIGKAQAVALWSGETHLVHVTVAAADGSVVDPTSPLVKNLIAAVEAVRDPGHPFLVDSYQPLPFNLSAAVLIDGSYTASDVLSRVQEALGAAFTFRRRAFGQPVTAAEVVTTIQGVPGVTAVDLHQLYLTTDTAGAQQQMPEQILHADRARRQGDSIAPAQLLLLNPAGLTLVEMTP